MMPLNWLAVDLMTVISASLNANRSRVCVVIVGCVKIRCTLRMRVGMRDVHQLKNSRVLSMGPMDSRYCVAAWCC
jgi:hypothetical protein